MLMVSLKVLLAVHGHMFEALHHPRQLPTGLANWDVRQILQDQRKQVGTGGREGCVCVCVCVWGGGGGGGCVFRHHQRHLTPDSRLATRLKARHRMIRGFCGF